MATVTQYSDLDMTFTIHPVKGDISIITGPQDVITSVKNLIFTNFFERPFQPLLGSNLTKMLFEPISPLTSNYIQREISDVIRNYEPRAQLDSVVVAVNPDYNSYSVTITFYVVNQTQLVTVNLLLDRLR